MAYGMLMVVAAASTILAVLAASLLGVLGVAYGLGCALTALAGVAS